MLKLTLTQHCYNSHINNSASFCGFRQLGWTNFFYSIRLTTLGKPWTSRHALWFDLDQDGQGFLARLTNFWPHQPRPVQANCRPNFSAFPCQALPALTPASRGLSRPCTPFMFLCFSFSILAPANCGQARPGWPCGRGFPDFFIPWPTRPKPDHKPGSPWLSGRALTPVYPGLAGFLMQGYLHVKITKPLRVVV